MALVAETSLYCQRVARELDVIIALRGLPLLMVGDNGTERNSRAMLQWQQDNQVKWHSIAPGKPMRCGIAAMALPAPFTTPDAVGETYVRKHQQVVKRRKLAKMARLRTE